MAFVSVTRLRPRSLRFLPGVALHTWRSRRQLRRAPGFLGGYLASGPHLTLWTVTVWQDEAAMRAYRNAAPHLKAMPKLIGWCDEAAVVHWTADDSAIPSPAEAAERMKGGRLSKVRHPSPGHAAGDPWPDGKVPLKGPALVY
jgi:hypothetical protein